MPKPDRKARTTGTRSTRAVAVRHQASDTMENPVSGFSEKEASYAASPEGAASPRLSERQQKLRQILLESPAEDAVRTLEAGEFSLKDGIAVALDSLSRSNAIVEEMIGRSGKARRQFETRSRRIDARLRENGQKLTELVGDGR